jgi:sigma-B regulation protein RsbU (phosphoserine phosphatase)
LAGRFDRPSPDHGGRSSNGELERLREMRRALLPKGLPERPALDMASCFLPADDNVGGDFFVLGEGRDGSTILVVGDVVGRGLDAALRASYIRALLIGFVRSCDDPARILELTNAALTEGPVTGADFATAVCVVHRPERAEIAWALAGHPPPLRLSDGEPLVPPVIAPPLAIDPDFRVEGAVAPFEPGDGVLVYTDGITEARSGSGDFFGDDRLQTALAELGDLDPADLVAALRDRVQEFTGTEWSDDACMLALRAKRSLAIGDADEVCSPHLVAGS